MNVLLVGGASDFLDKMIIKLKKEGHRVYHLTGNKYKKERTEKVFEKYHFDYESDNLSEVFESVSPDVTIYMGAYDSNFSWKEEQKESISYLSAFMNIMAAFSKSNHGKFILLSSHEVYGTGSAERIHEDEAPNASGFRGMAFSQCELVCENYREKIGVDTVILRLDHLCSIPRERKEVTDICSTMILSALENKYIVAKSNNEYSVLFDSDAVEFIYKIVAASEHTFSIYNLSSNDLVKEEQIARCISEFMDNKVEVTVCEAVPSKVWLSNERYKEEFGMTFFAKHRESVYKVVQYMTKHKDKFIYQLDEDKSLWQKFREKQSYIVRSLIPFIENLICFIPFFMLNNRATGSEYFSNLDFYLLYVLLFAIIYGQQQAIFSATLAVIGYCFRQMYDRSSFAVMLDYNTYVWITQLFILGLVVGYMRDELRIIKTENEEEKEHMNRQLSDILDINSSNVRVKDVLERQVIDQRDSIGKIYSMTSALDQYTSDEVLFAAVELIGRVMDSKDVAIYSIQNSEYARLFSSTSKDACKMGNSVKYKEMGEVYEALYTKKVYINRKMDDKYPLMANAIYENDEMHMIIFVWGIPWERMTLGQANLLTVVSYLIQNALLRAERYMAAIENQRYLGESIILEEEAFTALLNVRKQAEKRKLADYTIIRIDEEGSRYEEVAEIAQQMLRQTDYMGIRKGALYILLANTQEDSAMFVMSRLQSMGINSTYIGEDI